MTAAHERVQVWDVPALTPAAQPLVLEPPIEAADLSADGKLLLSADGTGTLAVREVGSDRPRWTVRHPGGVTSASFSPDGARVLVVRRGEHVARMLDAADGKEDFRVTADTRVHYSPDPVALQTAMFAPSGDTFLTSGGGPPQVWSARTGNLIATLGRPGTSRIAFSPDGRRIVYDIVPGARVSDARTGKRLGETEPEIRSDTQVDNIITLAFGPDGRTFATTVTDGARVWDARTCEALTPAIKILAASSLSYSPCARWLATGSAVEAGAVWEVATGRRVCTIADTTRSAFDPVVAFSPAGGYLAVNFGDTVELWEYRK